MCLVVDGGWCCCGSCVVAVGVSWLVTGAGGVVAVSEWKLKLPPVNNNSVLGSEFWDRR